MHKIKVHTKICIGSKYLIKCFFSLFLAILFISPIFSEGGNNKSQELPFASGEQLYFNIRYKWGIIMAKAGTAQYSVTKETYDFSPIYRSSLSFRTTSGFDKIFKIRDTLYSYSSMKLEPVYHKKYLNEGNTHYTEELFFDHYSSTYTKARSLRYNSEGNLKFEKSLEASEHAFDMVSIFMFARTLNYEELTPGTVISLSSFVGRDVVKMKARYRGQVILDKGSDKKYKTLKFELDIIDDAFEANKNAIEMWISDDQNRYPLKIKAKLKIGAAEAELTSFKGNKYPLNSLIVIKSKD